MWQKVWRRIKENSGDLKKKEKKKKVLELLTFFLNTFLTVIFVITLSQGSWPMVKN